MSMEHSEQVVCPKCKREQTVTIWQSLNVDVSAEAKEALFNGEINSFVCVGCGEYIVIPIPLVYHDMKRNFAVQFFPFEAVGDMNFIKRFEVDGSNREVEEVFSKMPVGIRNNAASQYLRRPHIVFSMRELVRYILFREKIFETCENEGKNS